MKKIIILLMCVSLSLSINAQTKLTYSEVVQTVDSTKQSELYNRAKVWFATAYNSSSDVIQLDNKDDGMIIGKAIIPYHSNVHSGSETTKGNIKYTISIVAKEGRYKYEITDFIHDAYGNQYGKTSMGLITTDSLCPTPKPMAKNWSDKVWTDIKNQIDDNIQSLISSLKAGMNQPGKAEETEW